MAPPRSPEFRPPRKKLVPSSVSLEQEMWGELSEVASFHSEVFRATGDLQPEDSFSRNEVVQNFLRWALDSYWADKGGRPATDKERTEKIARAAEQARKKAQQK